MLTMRHRPGHGRTVDYRFDGRPAIFVKSYTDAIEGLASYRILRSLWSGQFGPASAYRVPEPIAYLAEHRAHIISGAPGHCLLEFKNLPRDAWESALRAAAVWLARLHASSAGLGPREIVTQEDSRLAGRLEEAVARRPELEAELVRLVETLAERGVAARGSPTDVQVHGRYHAEHVYLAPDCVTVIDLDRAARGEAARRGRIPPTPARRCCPHQPRSRGCRLGHGNIPRGIRTERWSRAARPELLLVT